MACKRNVVFDGGWSWIVLCSAFVAMALSFGLLLSSTVFLADFKLQFDIGSREAGILTGTYLLFTTLTGPVASYVCNKVGFRAIFMISGLIISFSIILSSVTTTYYQMLGSMMLTGIGFSFSYTPASVIMGFYFRKHYVLANGIVFAGAQAGLFSFPILLECLRSTYNWRICYRLIAAASLHLCVAGALIPPPPSVEHKPSNPPSAIEGTTSRGSSVNYQNTNDYLEEDPNVDIIIIDLGAYPNTDSNGNFEKVELPKDVNETDTIVRHLSNVLCTTFELRLFLSLDFIIVFIIMLVYSVGYMGTIVHYVARFEWAGFTSVQSGFLLSLMGMGGVTSRLTHGLLVDKKYIKATHMFFLNLVLTGIVVISLTFISSYTWSQFMSFVIGASMGVFAPLGPVIMKDLVGIERFNSAFGLILVAYGVSDFIGSLLTGWIYDLTNDYNKPFYMTSACLLSASILMMIVMVMDHKKSTKQSVSNNC